MTIHITTKIKCNYGHPKYSSSYSWVYIVDHICVFCTSNIVETATHLSVCHATQEVLPTRLKLHPLSCSHSKLSSEVDEIYNKEYAWFC
jgi:hypothetical protein